MLIRRERTSALRSVGKTNRRGSATTRIFVWVAYPAEVDGEPVGEPLTTEATKRELVQTLQARGLRP